MDVFMMHTIDMKKRKTTKGILILKDHSEIDEIDFELDYLLSLSIAARFQLMENKSREIKYYSGYYFVKPIGLTVMNNHFHLLIKSEPESYYSDDQVNQRIAEYRDKKKKKEKEKGNEEDWEEEGDGEISYNELQRIKKQMADISEYVRAIKQTFSRRYNKMNNRGGYLWGDRFKSVLIEK